MTATFSPLPTYERRMALVLAVLMLAFSLPKLLALPVSLALFDKINAYMGWQGRWFMYLTGVLELFCGALLLAVLAVKDRHWQHTPYRLYLLGLLAVAGTMLGALFTELAIRPGEDPVLTLLALLLLAQAAILLLRNRPYWPILSR